MNNYLIEQRIKELEIQLEKKERIQEIKSRVAFLEKTLDGKCMNHLSLKERILRLESLISDPLMISEAVLDSTTRLGKEYLETLRKIFIKEYPKLNLSLNELVKDFPAKHDINGFDSKFSKIINSKEIDFKQLKQEFEKGTGNNLKIAQTLFRGKGIFKGIISKVKELTDSFVYPDKLLPTKKYYGVGVIINSIEQNSKTKEWKIDWEKVEFFKIPFLTKDRSDIVCFYTVLEFDMEDISPEDFKKAFYNAGKDSNFAKLPNFKEVCDRWASQQEENDSLAKYSDDRARGKGGSGKNF